MNRILLESTSFVYPVVRFLQDTEDDGGSGIDIIPTQAPIEDNEYDDDDDGRGKVINLIMVILWCLFIAPCILYWGWRNHRWYCRGERERIMELNREQRRRQMDIQRMARARTMAAASYNNGSNNNVAGSLAAHLTEEERQELLDKETKKGEWLRTQLAKVFEDNQIHLVIRKEDLNSGGSGDAKDGGGEGDLELGTVENSSKHGGTVQLPSTAGSRKVPSSCAICLEAYQEGETIAWSTGNQCIHAFHEDCITEYLVHLNTAVISTQGNGPSGQSKSPCPCCRQSFCKIPTMKADLR